MVRTKKDQPGRYIELSEPKKTSLVKQVRLIKKNTTSKNKQKRIKVPGKKMRIKKN